MSRLLENRLEKLERATGRQQGPGAIFLVGVDPKTRQRTCNTAIIVGGENLHREPGETQEDFAARVARAGGTAQVFLPEKEPCE